MERIPDSQLVPELRRLGIQHLSSQPEDILAESPLSPVQLLCGMVLSPDARVRMALVPLFLHCPHYSTDVPMAVAALAQADLPKPEFEAPPGDTLKLYYQAAVYLQVEFQQGEPLADLYSAEFGLISVRHIHSSREVNEALKCLAALHRRLAGSNVVNWAASYRHQLKVYRRAAAPHT